MSFNGSGTFVINSTGQPVVTGTVISSTAFNALTADLATGLSTTLTKDGQTTATANIPMGSFKFTGLSAGSAATDSANIAQVQNSFGSFLTVSGTDTITATVSPSLTAYAAGQMFAFVAANTNTGAVTINISSLGAKAITKNGNTALSAGDLTANYLFVVVYDGTQFQVVGVSATTFTNLTISGVLTLSGAGTQLVSTGTGAWQPPAGTTGQRPGSPSPGAQRWNSTLLVYEIYNGFIWQPVASQTYTVNYLVVAGGGGGGWNGGGGGAAGGLLASSTSLTSGTSYTVTVGAGGAGATTLAVGSSGSNSSISGVSITSTGGGGGGSTSINGASGGSGGGGGQGTSATTGGAGTSGQGFAGGNGTTLNNSGGGGGASAVGANGSGTTGGNGGAGSSSLISGASLNYAGGGGGGSNGTQGSGGVGGGGAGFNAAVGGAGSANTGGGGGGSFSTTGGAGGSGIVVIAYASASQRGTGGTVTTSGGFYIHTFTSSGTYTA